MSLVLKLTIAQGHTLLARHAGSNAQLLMSLLNQHTNTPQAIQPLSTTTQSPAAPTAPIAPANETDEQLDERCRQLMNKHKVVLFMKGNPSAPKCGFSRQTVGLLREKGVEFAWFDILSDQAVRERLKKLNDWPSESGLAPRSTSSLTWIISSVPANHPQWRTYRRSRHFPRIAREWRMGRDVCRRKRGAGKVDIGNQGRQNGCIANHAWLIMHLDDCNITVRSHCLSAAERRASNSRRASVYASLVRSRIC